MAGDDKALTSKDISAAEPVALDRGESTLDPQERAVLEIDVAYVQWRADFRRMVVASGVLNRPWRSVFEADMIFSIVAHRWLAGRPITHKELATYFETFATEATVSRHVDDMEDGGMIVRQTDPDDRRRTFLLPTKRLEAIGHEYLRTKIRIMRDHGFAWAGGAETGCEKAAAAQGNCSD
ncbi:MAG: MarR family transcriptional regulator [Afipia sp.]|nr:MarR family transcriptional regulator [Afipia sp.]